MSILGGDGFTLPVVTPVEVVDVHIEFTDSAKSAMKENMDGDEKSHVLIISAQSGGCSGYLYDCLLYTSPSPRD